MTKRKARRSQNGSRREMAGGRMDRARGPAASQGSGEPFWRSLVRGRIGNVWVARTAFAFGLSLVIMAALMLSEVTAGQENAAANEIALAVAVGFVGMLAAITGIRSLGRLSESPGDRRK